MPGTADVPQSNLCAAERATLLEKERKTDGREPD
jgi:hypothetical protein